MVHAHTVSKKFYFLIFATLLVLTFVTYKVASKQLGEWNTIVAITIAVTKATLVVLYFMHVRWSDSVIRIVVVAGFFWLGILFALTGSDYLTRGLLFLR